MNMGYMGARIVTVFAVFRKLLDKDLDMGDYKNRLIVQKMTYMLKFILNRFDYSFSWYVRGPYSPTLTSEAFKFDDNSAVENYEFDDNEKYAIERIRCLFNVRDENAWELFASILYMLKENNVTDKDKLVFMVHSLKPWFTEEQIIDAFNKIQTSGILGS